jgi:hypothetical protein
MDPEQWAAWTPDQIADRLRGLRTRWAIAGGWAIDLFVGGTAREHDDLEIVVGPDGFAEVQDALTDLEWFTAANGQVHAIGTVAARLDHTWQTWGWDPIAHRWRVDVIREPWTRDTWVYRRNRSLRRPLLQAIELTYSGIPYLAPEIVLLFKAKHHRQKDEADFDRSQHLLDVNQRGWLRSAIAADLPNHPWLERLGA